MRKKKKEKLTNKKLCDSDKAKYGWKFIALLT
jgi:hypothetical protein